MKRIVSFHSPALKKTPSKRKVLNKPSSWAKLITMIAVVLAIAWINVKPENKAVTNTDAGQVAGVEDTAEESERIIDNSAAKIEEVAQQIQEDILPAGPTKAEKATQELIGETEDLRTLLVEGKKYLDQNKFSEALVIYQRATEVAPDYRDAWYLLGYTYLKAQQTNPTLNPFVLSKPEQAVIALTHAAAIDPLSQAVKDLLVVAQKAVNNSE